MSNTSYTFKENSQMKDIQGGEKKVMKKILSVALSTAMAFSMFASVAFGAESQTPQQQFDALKAKGILTGYPDGSAHLEKTITRAELAKVIVKTLGLKEITGVYSFKDKNYNAKNWAAPYIEAVSSSTPVIMQGKDTAKKIFDFNGNVTVEELATVLVRALNLTVPTEGVDNSATAWAKGYVQAAINAGYLEKGINYQAAATRSQVVVAAYAVDQQRSIPTVASYKVVDANNVEFTLSNQEVVKVKLDKALEANKETAVEFKDSKGNTIATKVTYVVTTATKVASVSASNLKEVVVAFDGEVDKATAEDASNYSLNNSKIIESASLSSDGKTVTLTLDTTAGTALTNQVEYKLTLNNIKAGNTVISAKDVAFTPVDAALPVAQSAEALGNKTIKVAFSEPVQTASAANLKIDGVPVVGYTSINGKTLIVKVYSALSNGEHTISVNGVSDYSSLKSLATDLKFTVAEDTTAPTIKAVTSATFEKVRLQFSEPVDPATVLGTNVYWLSGTSKQYASSNVTQISDDTFEFDFNANKIQYATDLYVTGVKDYSGNAIADNTKVSVSPVLDQTRPEVVNAELDSTNQVITVKFNKTLTNADVIKGSNYVIKDKDGKEVSKLKTPVLQADNKTVKVTLSSALSQGASYTLEISGISDTTTLHNVMLPYTKKFDIADTTGANTSLITANSVTNGGLNRIVVTYPKVMSVSGDGSAVEASKYFYATTAAPSTWVALPSGTGLNITPDGKSVIISFPSDVAVTTIANIRVQLVKDSAGNYISGLTKDVAVGNAAVSVLQSSTATANNKVSVLFDQNLLSNTVNPSDFVVKSTSGEVLTVIAASLDADNAKKVNLTLADATKLSDDAKYNTRAVTVDVKANATTATAEGRTVASNAGGAVTLTDKIAASVDTVVGSANGTSLKVNFNEPLKAATGSALTNYATDLVVTDENGTVLQPGTGYTVDAVTAGDKFLTINFGATQHKGVMSVAIANPRFILDASNNIVASQAAIDVAPDASAPTVTTALANGNATGIATSDDATITFSEALNTASKTAVETALKNAVTGAASSDLTFGWVGGVLTITNNSTTNVAKFGTSDVKVNITDLAGNTTSNAVIVTP
ncbi:Ig-like domain-containing protein [Paenibacillus sp. SN-8-1]|uniref:Ig-like domain-containing protein n=1 Tax=Paenibacillus sp. SN-8-1 TaxID=3435409 RepID=UPI003D9A2705